jgi:pyridinium-3,5-biscarboxylic acid mononucleotide sulfurtransferase
LTKAEIREWSAQLGLPTADKQQLACLSSRVPHGEPVTPEKLRMIEAAENILRDLGFHDVRVRLHELRVASDEWRVTGNGKPATRHPSPVASLARIELGPSEIRRFLEDGISTKVVEALGEIGYAHVTLDLEGYRRAGGPVKLLARNGFR